MKREESILIYGFTEMETRILMHLCRSNDFLYYVCTDPLDLLAQESVGAIVNMSKMGGIDLAFFVKEWMDLLLFKSIYKIFWVGHNAPEQIYHYLSHNTTFDQICDKVITKQLLFLKQQLNLKLVSYEIY